MLRARREFGHRDTDTQVRTSCGDRGRDWSEASTGPQSIPRVAGNHLKLGLKQGTDSPPRASGRNKPHKHLNFRLSSPRIVRA